jgi:N-methylhydantoinase A
MNRVSVDIGGTFTDCFLVWKGGKFGGKALTTHHNLALGFNNALMNAAAEAELDGKDFLGEIESIRYATTLGTNALIERSGPRIGLLVTAGFEATVPLSRGRGYGDGMPDLVQRDLPNAQRPAPLVPMTLIAGVHERVDGHGGIVIPLDEEHLRAQIRRLVDQGAQAFVVALVNSVVNPEHEFRVEEIILDEYPSHMLGSLPVTLSHLVSGRTGEYVRASSAIINAYLHAVMYHGLASMEQQLRESGYGRPMMLVHNSGGMAQLNSTSALQTIHSGPVAGISAAERLGGAVGVQRLVCADMGGTSFDISLVVGGDVKFYDFYPVIDRWLCTVPMVHLISLGAGGGSIARFDPMYKGVEVGPESAGSEPGPACFNRGGTKVTVTDADLLLGYLDPDNYAAGRIKLNRRRSERAIRDDIAEPMGLSLEQAALAVKAKVDANMGNGIARELRSKGYEPHDFTMLAYGGNGPLHACGIGDAIGMTRVFIPPFSAVFSALGAGNIDQVHIHERSREIWLFDAGQHALLEDFDEINGLISELEDRGREDLVRQGLDSAGIRHRLELDMRYGNQLAHTSVGTDITRFADQADVMGLIAKFAQDYQQRFGEGSAQPQAGIVVTALRVVTYVDDRKVDFSRLVPPVPDETVRSEPKARRHCVFQARPDGVETDVHAFETLRPGTVVEGPAVIVSRVTTILVEPGWRFVMGDENAAWLLRHE